MKTVQTAIVLLLDGALLPATNRERNHESLGKKINASEYASGSTAGDSETKFQGMRYLTR
jgi:hypothetical protein